MKNATFDIEEICGVLNEIDLFEFETNIFLSAIEEINKSSNIILQDSDVSSSDSPSDKINALRLFQTPVYISLEQIKINLKSSLFSAVLKAFYDYASNGEIKVAALILKQLLPQIIGCIHLVTKEERCIYNGN